MRRRRSSSLASAKETELEGTRLVEEVRAQIGREGLLVRGRPVLVMLSGGRDSTCLLDAAIAVAGPDCVRGMHMDYGLRPESADEARHCAALCEALGVGLEVRRPRRRREGNLQAWARAERYDAALELAGGADVAAGHTATDQVETILYRLASSPSRRAVLGMAPREGPIIRPLIGVQRATTAEYCRARGLRWCEDPSNDALLYARARVRNGLLPALRTIHPAAERNLLALAATLREETEVLDALAREAIGPGESVRLETLRALPVAVARLAVQQLSDRAAGAPAAGVGRRLEDLLALGSRGTVELHVGAGLRAVVEYGSLRFEPLRAAETLPAPEAQRLRVPGQVSFGAREVSCRPGPVEPADGVLDRDALAGELVVRPARPGDRIAPVGLGGTKRLQDLFTARRVPRAVREFVPVVESEGEIAWVGGLATSDRFKVTTRTRRAVHLRLHPE